jgi:hypothetical protein
MLMCEGCSLTGIVLLSRAMYTWEMVKISGEGREVLSDLLVELAGFYLLSIPGYFVAQDWGRLTITIIFCMICVRFAIQWRKKYDKFE